MACWYAVYTRPRWEKRVVELLQKKRIEHYCPYTKVVNAWHGYDRKKAVFQPVFSSYVFVKTTEDALDFLKTLDGVINIVYWRDKPAVIRDIEIEMIKRFLNEHESINLEKSVVNTNEIVKIINTTLDSENDEPEPLKKVKLVLPSLGFIMEAIEEKEMDIILQPDIRPLSTRLAKFG